MNNLFKIGILFIVPIIAQMVLGEDFCNDPFDREILKRSEFKPDWPTTAEATAALLMYVLHNAIQPPAK